MVTIKEYVSGLNKIDACSEAVNWVSAQATPQEAWDSCADPKWMLWLVGRLSVEPGSSKRKDLVLCCCTIARSVLHLAPEGEHRPEIALVTAEQWALGDESVTLQDVRDAAYAASSAAAYAASSAADAAYAAYAAYDAYDAADAAADAAAYAYAAYADAAYDAAYADAARKAQNEKSCKIIREFYPEVPTLPE